MRTFILRARKGSTKWERLRAQVGSDDHFEVVLHSIINAFFISSDFRTDVEFYIILDSSDDYPRTIKLSSAEGLSLSGFHENAILALFEETLKSSQGLSKDETKKVAKGIEVSAFGFERLISRLIQTRPLYLLDKKGTNIRDIAFKDDPVFILTDHLVMPKKTLAGLKRQGLETLSLGNTMLFASQCVTLINYELDLI